MLKQRIATALVLVAIFLSALYFLPPFGFSLFVGAIVLWAAWEWANLVGLRRLISKILYLLATAGILVVAASVLDFDGELASRDGQFEILLSGCIWWAVALLWVQGFPSSSVLWGNKWVKALMGWFVLVPTWLAFAILLTDDSAGPFVVLFVAGIVVLMDTGGYVAGRLFGRSKLAPNVSPGKTWAGFVGGLLANVLLIVIAGLLLELNINQWGLLAALVLITACASVLGDLLESMVKRERQVKDSGGLLPGHGGILDRVDGMTAAFPVFTLLYLLVAQGLFSS